MANAAVRDSTPPLYGSAPAAPPALQHPTQSAAESGEAQLPAASPVAMSSHPAAAVSGAIRRVTPRIAAAAVSPPVASIATVGIALAPGAAMLASVWALIAGVVALSRLAALLASGQALTSSTTLTLLQSLDVAARIGFLSLSYLALIFALISLMGGLFGRRWGRLFILPGAALTGSALALMAASAALAAPLLSALPFSGAWLAPIALYALLDAVLVSGFLTDTRLTRAPSPRRRRRASPRRRGGGAATPA